MTVGGADALDGFYDALLDDDAEQLYDKAPCGYLSTTPDGTIIKVNQTFLALTGYARADLVGRRTFAELLSPGGRIYHETHYAPMLRMQGTAREIALDVVRADGSRLPVLVNAVLETDESGTPLVVRTAVFDATDRREYERELMRAKADAEASEATARRLAETLQQTLIPPTPPEIPGLRVAAAYRPAGDGAEVGGDFYDVFQVGDGEWVVVIGDVRGKGVEAAVVTALARYTLRAAAVQRREPTRILAALNDALLGNEIDRFCTVLCLRLALRDERWHATVACGGHPLPVLLRTDRPPAAIGVPGTLLGVIDEPALTDATLDLTAGDLLLLYTDGVTEARESGGGFYGEQRLQAVLTQAPARDAEGLAGRLLDDVLEFQGGRARDDIALVVIEVPASVS